MTKQLRGASEQVGTDVVEVGAAPAEPQTALSAVEGESRRGKHVVKLASHLQAAAMTEPSGTPACERCEELTQQVRELRELRDRTLEDLARAREQVNALRLHRESFIPPPPPPSDAPPPPLRYVIADRINAELKRYLGPVHLRTKWVLDLAAKRGGRR